ncbi:hypothetical protein CLAFUW4_12365 [Fulvia fulva]|uniref:Uncharacterized protein n=1 Tax=Passalora fulva TaxID=5499 RepID=A0A9Q8US84_PASFU|nr:uncharacterized protein CLAFUR5_11394 [Fulvia fulva]KAK4617698.1 hypothetical protein CLAFUR4_12370 [Fulvia fulva]KAK4618741.1 hypothetical protein CLAFUR0_12381 [Fulvia fulva]UJO20502.1 hypothetical protein CLAFUR5_11394 [Fulvia fulva]WPV18321.1 hypothetical protein CLAFUW4_12365 [Fulvia fulva]WPV33116.1 hypothetical protein CLAFUW7_12372 [Fulvia fulva]
MSSAPVLVVLGSGPGIGISTAKLFAQRHFGQIALVSRNAERLENDKKEVEQAGKEAGKHVEVHTLPTNIGDLDQLPATLAKIQKLGPLGCVFYNAARIRSSDILMTPVEELEEDFKVA